MSFDEMLSEALGETVDERIEKMLTVTPKPGFSLSYRLWEHKTLNNLRQNRSDNRWTLRKARRIVITVFAATIIMLTLTAFAVVGMTVGRFSFNDQQEYSELFLSKISSDKTCIEEFYGLPEEDGWNIDYFDDLTDSTMIRYTRGEYIVAFCQEIIHENMGHVNTENAKVESMSIYEENDGFFIAFQDGSFGLWWIYDGYLLSMTGNLDKNEMVNLAYSTKIVNF